LFKEGKIAIQDPSATLAVRLANPQQDWEVADICSAPGGKAFFNGGNDEKYRHVLLPLI
jgi:16S rRNA C967 or C1407 C5-methylase (RsmB/RsmF family)